MSLSLLLSVIPDPDRGSSVVVFAFVCHPRPRSGIQCRFPDEQEEKKKPLDSRLLTSGMTEGGTSGMTEGGKVRMTEGERARTV